MPRPQQKRGKRAKHRHDVEIVREPPTLPPARLPSPVPAADADGKAHDAATPEWPLLDPDTRAYFQQINDKIIDLETLGVGQHRAAQDQLDDNDERVLIIRGSLASLNGHEIEMATDPEASYVLERLLYSMDDFARRVLADRFVGQYAQLAKNRFACHVLQTLFYLGSYTIDREARGIFSSGPSSATVDLGTMSELLAIACAELIPDISHHLYDAHATHLLRSSLLLVTGSAFPEDMGSDRLRSKSSRNYKKRLAPLRSLLPDEQAAISRGKERERAVPAAFGPLRAQLFEAVDVALGRGTDGAAARQAGADPVASVIVQMMVGFEADEHVSDQPGSLLDRLLEGLGSRPLAAADIKFERKGYIDTVMRDAHSSHLMEIIVSRAPQAVFAALWNVYYRGHLEKLAGHAIANFTVASGIARLELEAFQEALSEIAGTEVARTSIVHSRVGPLKALADRSATLQSGGNQISRMLVRALDVEHADRTPYLVMAALALSPYDMLSKNTACLDFSGPPEPALQGSLLLQSWLKMDAEANDIVLQSLLSMPISYLISLCRHAVASRVVDTVLESPSVAGKNKRKLVIHMLRQYHLLADDRIGSRVADRCWDFADLFSKEKIVKSLLPHLLQLSGSKIGHFFARKVQLALYDRKPEEWRSTMAATPPLAQAGPQSNAALQPSSPTNATRKRDDVSSQSVDEIDRIFAQAKKARLSNGFEA